MGVVDEKGGEGEASDYYLGNVENTLTDDLGTQKRVTHIGAR
jgi:hypothetical protein